MKKRDPRNMSINFPILAYPRANWSTYEKARVLVPNKFHLELTYTTVGYNGDTPLIEIWIKEQCNNPLYYEIQRYVEGIADTLRSL